MSIRPKIETVFATVMRQMMHRDPPPLHDDLVLLASGLDSLGFAALIARLEDELGMDPFSASGQPFYPTTFGEFVACYEHHAAHTLPGATAR